VRRAPEHRDQAPKLSIALITLTPDILVI
jgi:hypothetical protein